MNTPIHWFEIFVADLDRAVRFYQTTLGIELRRVDFTGKPMAIFPKSEGAAGGALVRDPARAPGGAGTLVYLGADGKLDACLARVAHAGGSVLLPRTDIGEPGLIAVVRDTEGNSVGLHSER
ncbi:MAG TPA: VOC family protein [Myxococcales bacterium]|jgi:predicted enzyme related to lactoylglutathione lyase|nr:VOC family protein [Myxococcales bacterium]